MVTDRTNIAIANTESHVAFPLAYLHLTVVNSKGQIKVMHISIANFSPMVTETLLLPNKCNTNCHDFKGVRNEGELPFAKICKGY